VVIRLDGSFWLRHFSYLLANKGWGLVKAEQRMNTE
jgi:hypothetical protein